MSKLLKCSKCGHYHFGITKKDIDQNAVSFSAWLKTLSQDRINDYYGGTLPEVPTYEHCFNCEASYTEMLLDDHKCPRGVTLQGIRNDIP